MDRRVLPFVGSLLFTVGCGLVLDAGPPRGDAALGGGMDAPGRRDGGTDAPIIEPRDAGSDDVTQLDASRGEAGAVDAARGDAPAGDAPHIDAWVDPCEGRVRGAPCGDAPRAICLGGVCAESTCGDGFVDTVLGESCEPTAASIDSCVMCRPACNGDGDCDTGTPCVVGRCELGSCVITVIDGGACGPAAADVCVEGACVPRRCHDGAVDPGEDCDVGTESTLGCSDCRFDCADGSCDDGDACNGLERCEGMTVGGVLVGRTCVDGDPPPACMPLTSCHDAVCITTPGGRAGCQQVLVAPDLDGDGFAVSDACGPAGGDCNDGDASIHPGAREPCNTGVTVDADCDPMTIGPASLRWYADVDGDGFGNAAVFVDSCSPPGGLFALNSMDCLDGTDPDAAYVFPGQTDYFSRSYNGPAGRSFDWNCDGAITRQYEVVEECRWVSLERCSAGAGWEGRSIPDCGETRSWIRCERGLLFCTGERESRTQGCR